MFRAAIFKNCIFLIVIFLIPFLSPFSEGPYTVFLPSNEALTKIPADELAVLKENSTVLRG